MAKDDTSKTSIAARGRVRIVEYAVRKDGSVPAKVFFDSLNERDQAWLLVRFRMLADEGKRGISNEDVFRREREIPEDIKGTGGWLWAFKKKTKKRPGGGKGLIRMPCFMVGERWILTHGLWKPPQPKWPEPEYTKAFTIIREVMDRERQTQQREKG